MKKYENFCASLKNMKEIYDYDEPYNTVVLTGLVGLYEICFEQSWKMMKEILEIHGYEEGATGSPKIILRTAYREESQRDGKKASVPVPLASFFFETFHIIFPTYIIEAQLISK